MGYYEKKRDLIYHIHGIFVHCTKMGISELNLHKLLLDLSYSDFYSKKVVMDYLSLKEKVGDIKIIEDTILIEDKKK